MFSELMMSRVDFWAFCGVCDEGRYLTVSLLFFLAVADFFSPSQF